MKHTSAGAFTRAEAGTVPPIDFQLGTGESVVGWYRNPPPWDAHLIVFTTTGFYVCDPEGNRRILAADIVDYRRPESKEVIDGVTVVTKHGPVFVRIAGTSGSNGQQKDAHSFIMVLRGLLSVKQPDWSASDEPS